MTGRVSGAGTRPRVYAQVAEVVAGLHLTSVVPSRSGRQPDWRRGLQVANELVATAGHRLLGERWPLAMAHVFVLRKGEIP